MKAPKRKESRKVRGSVLLYSIIMLTVAGTAVVTATSMVTMNLREVQRTEARLQAFYAAEAGIQQTVDWFNRAYYAYWRGEFTGGGTASADGEAGYQPASFNYTPFSDSNGEGDGWYTWDDELYENSAFQDFFAPHPVTGRFLDPNDDSIVKTTLDVAKNFETYLPKIKNRENKHVARIRELKIVPPKVGDPPKTVCEVICEAEVDGPNIPTVRFQVSVMLYDNKVVDIKIPAAILSKAAVSGKGQLNVNWGEIWSKDDIVFPNTAMNGVPTQTEDPWFNARAERHVMIGNSYADGTANNGTSNSPIAVGQPHYKIPYLDPPLDSKNKGKFGDRENLHQHATLKWPDYDYETMKELIQQLGYPIFGTTSDGNLIVPTASGTAKMSFMDVFNRKRVTVGSNGYVFETLNPSDVDREEMPPLYFIDTLDGKAPKSDGSNMAKITIAGNGPFFHGFFFAGANFEFKGSGNAPTITAEKPNMTPQSISKVTVHGLIHTYGYWSDQGVGSIYGAIYSEDGHGAGGCPDVYYDWRMADMRRNRLGSAVRARLWDNQIVDVAQAK